MALFTRVNAVCGQKQLDIGHLGWDGQEGEGYDIAIYALKKIAGGD